MANFELINQFSIQDMGPGSIHLSDFVFHKGQFLFFPLEDSEEGGVGATLLPLQDGSIIIPESFEYGVLDKKIDDIHLATGDDELCIWSRGVKRKKGQENFYDMLLARGLENREFILDGTGERIANDTGIEMACSQNPQLARLNEFSTQYFHVVSSGTPGRLELSELGVTLRHAGSQRAILSFSQKDYSYNSLNHYYYVEKQSGVEPSEVGFNHPQLSGDKIFLVTAVKKESNRDEDINAGMFRIVCLQLTDKETALEQSEKQAYLESKKNEIENQGGSFISKWWKKRAIRTDTAALYGDSCSFFPAEGKRLRRVWQTQPHEADIWAACAAGGWLYTGDRDGNVKVTDTQTGEVFKSFSCQGSIRHMHYSKDPELLYIISWGGWIYVVKPKIDLEPFHSGQLDPLCGFEQKERAQRQVDDIKSFIWDRGQKPKVVLKVHTEKDGNKIVFLELNGMR